MELRQSLTLRVCFVFYSKSWKISVFSNNYFKGLIKSIISILAPGTRILDLWLNSRCNQKSQHLLLPGFHIHLWQHGLSSTSRRGVQNWKYFCLKINIPRGNYWILSKKDKIWLSKPIFYLKNHWNLSHFFSLKNVNLGAHFSFLTFFDNINF